MLLALVDLFIPIKISLLSSSEATSITINYNDSDFNSNDRDTITELISTMSNATLTNNESVQDAPNQDNHIKIHLTTKESINTFFIYMDGYDLKIEQPYVGVYSINNNFKNLINNICGFNFCLTKPNF